MQYVKNVTFSNVYVRVGRMCRSTFGATNNTKQIMGNLLYVVAVVLIILWAIGYLGYNAGGLIHILLVIALIAIVLRVIQGRRID
jgi:hypothetical protein